MVIPPTRFDDETIDTLLDDTEQALQELGVEMDTEAFLVIIEELAYNAMQHSGEAGGIFALDIVDDQILAKVEDSGVGIRSTMSRNYPDISEGEAVLKAFMGEATSTGFESRGGGLYLTLGYTRQVPGCLLNLYTGEVVYVGLNGRGKLLASSGFSHQGVLVEIMVPLSHREPSL